MEAASPPDRLRLLLAAVLVLGPAAIVQACADQDSAAPADVELEAGPEAETPALDAAPAERKRERLSQTGLYSDIAAKTLAPDMLAFRPAYTLWSDGADKSRWIRLPSGTTIDTTDPDHWVFPVGTQLFKEFARDGKRLETRLVERIAATGKTEVDYWAGAFLWRDDESDADFVKDGASDVRGTTHDVPSAERCWTCHIGEPGHALGFSALQLSHTLGGVNLAMLRERGLVPATLADWTIPGDSATQKGVGWLHANCGHCHNVNGTSWPDTDMVLRFGYGETDVTASKLWASTMGVRVRSYRNAGFDVRIEPGSPDASAVFHRLSTRVDGGAMPPIATEVVDPTGTADVRAWIESLPPRDAGTE